MFFYEPYIWHVGRLKFLLQLLHFILTYNTIGPVSSGVRLGAKCGWDEVDYMCFSSGGVGGTSKAGF